MIKEIDLKYLGKLGKTNYLEVYLENSRQSIDGLIEN